MAGIGIFISHGAGQADAAPRAFAIRKCLFGKLRDAIRKVTSHGEAPDPPFQPFMDDEEISPGELWRLTIFRALASCQGAVVLLDPRARSRPWVVNEIIVLRLRKFYQTNFPLLIVKIEDPGVALSGEAQQTCQAYIHLLEPFQNDEYQHLHVTVATSVEDAASRILQWFEQQQFPSARLNQWVETMMTRLGALSQNAIVVEQLRTAFTDAERLEVSSMLDQPIAASSPWSTCVQHESTLRALAERLYALAPVHNRRLVEALSKAVKDKDDGRAFARLLYPLWVPPGHAISICAILGNNAGVVGRRLLAIQLPVKIDSGDAGDIAYRVMQRASFDLDALGEVQIVRSMRPNPWDGTDRLLKAEQFILESLRDKLCVGSEMALDDVLAELRDVIADEGKRYVFLLPEGWENSEILGHLLRRFPELYFVLFGKWTLPTLAGLLHPLVLERIHCVIQDDDVKQCFATRRMLRNLDSSKFYDLMS